ncbi:MAG: AMP-binding protein, partial [Pseudonocardia sp.]|nr:AMP-binding protein [Pseudonocardia sp.]
MRPTLWAEFEHALRRYGDRVAVSDGDRRLTYADVDPWSAAIAHQLRELGVRSGDAVGLHLDNCAEFVVADVAIARLGAVKVPVNPLLTEATVAHVLATAAVCALVVGPRTAPTALAASRAAPGVVLLEVGGGPIPLADPPSALPSAAPRPSAPRPDPPVSSTDTAAVYFTGGTTGLPKGVVHTQASAVAVHYAQLLEAEIGQDERLLLATPLAHAAGLFAQSALIRGATVVLLDGFDAHRVLDALGHERITWTFLVPTMIYRLLAAAADRPPLRHALRTIVYGAAPISPMRLAQALDVFGPVF